MHGRTIKIPVSTSLFYIGRAFNIHVLTAHLVASIVVQRLVSSTVPLMQKCGVDIGG